MTTQTLPNGTPIRHKDAAALAAGAKALRAEARVFAFDANLHKAGIRSPGGKNAHTQHEKLLRYAAALEALAGRHKAVST